jgi:hypothetical protein
MLAHRDDAAPDRRHKMESGGDVAHALPTSKQGVRRHPGERAPPDYRVKDLDALKRFVAQAHDGQGEDFAVRSLDEANDRPIDSAQTPYRTYPR